MSTQNKDLYEHFWEALRPSNTGELSEIEQESYRESKEILSKKRALGIKYLTGIKNTMDIRKIAYDMYVWQRVEATKTGIDRALKELHIIA